MDGCGPSAKHLATLAIGYRNPNVNKLERNWQIASQTGFLISGRPTEKFAIRYAQAHQT